MRRGWLLAAALLAGCGRPPQLGSDEHAFGAVDALFTAVRAKRPPMLEDCAAQLVQLRKAGSLPAAAAERLDEIIAEARAGQWDSSAVALAAFMKGQRRE